MDKKIILRICVIGFAIFFLVSIMGCGGDVPKIKWKSSDVIVNKVNPLLKVYLENSGSMDGYMCQGSEFKDAIYGYVSGLSPYVDSVQLNYINTDIIPYHRNIESFIRDLNPSTFVQAGGNRNNSDIAAMLNAVLQSMDDKTVSIFISDCILAIPGGEAEDFFINRQIELKNTFNQALRRNPNLGIEIFRMESNFNGIYYYSSGHERLINKKRPYYIFIMGDKHVLAGLNRKVPFSNIPHGVEDYYAYTTTTEIPFEITNRNGIGDAQKGTKCTNGKFRVNADLSSTLQEEEVLEDVKNYKNQSSYITLKKVSAVEEGNGGYTHVLTYSINKNIKPMAEQVILTQPSLPDWLETANDDTGANITLHLNQTTGIKYIVSGIAEAYKDYSLATFKFVISK